MVADDDALCEGFVHGHGQSPAQFGEADQEQAQSVVGVHTVVGEQSQVFEHFVSEVMSLIDDEHWTLFGLQGEA